MSRLPHDLLARRFSLLAAVTLCVIMLCVGAACVAMPASAQDFEAAPIEYSKRTPTDRVARLAAELKAGRKKLSHESGLGYLRALLKELQVPASSQTLVFSKTSLQRNFIRANTPRALYFNDDTYVGFCQDGDTLEISTVDDDLGAVFYTIDQDAEKLPQPVRQTDTCLICHASSATKNVPGHTLRSVYSDAAGYPMLSSGSYRTDQTSPFEHRWGGWYVSGTHAGLKHIGNIVHSGYGNPERADNTAGQNVTDLTSRVELKPYLTPHSDIVAMLVLAHQTEAHNHITHANFATRQALDYQENLNRELGLAPDELRESTTSRIRSACEPLVEYLFYCDEAPLAGKVAGTTPFAKEFAAQGPRDKQGRSLRDFDLERRIFKYPLSFLVYSSSFQKLPKEAKEYVYRRLREVLAGKDESRKFEHLSAEDRQAIAEILKETLPGFGKAH